MKPKRRSLLANLLLALWLLGAPSTAQAQPWEDTRLSNAQPSDPVLDECNEGNWGGRGAMPGCVVLHAGFAGAETSYDIDLLNIACDTPVPPNPPRAHTPAAQQAIIAQLATGTLHAMLQDDTPVLNAQLILNGGPLTVPCGAGTGGASPSGGTIINATDNSLANKLWNCETNRVPFGNMGGDVSRCFSFGYTVPPDGITSAILHITLQPSGGPSNDALVVAVGVAPSVCTWTGTWDTSYNKMELTQNGDKVTGSYVYNNGKLEGTVSGSVLAGTWTEASSSGGFQFTLAADCNSFTGTWGRGSDASSAGAWNGTRSGALPPPRPQPDPSVTTMTLQAAERFVVADQVILLPVWLVNSNNLANLNFEVKYDPSVVRLDGTLIKGNLLDNALFSGNTNEAGLIRIGLAQRSSTVAGTGTVVNIPFRAVGKPGTGTGLNLTITTSNDPSGGVLAIDRIDGAIWIMDQDGNFPPSGSGNNGAGNPAGSGNNGAGNPGSGPIIIPRGSCDGDQRLTEIDALCALDMSTGLRQPVLLIMDMDRSGDVTSRDAVLVLQQSVNQ